MKRALLCLSLLTGTVTMLHAQLADTLDAAEVRGNRSAKEAKDAYAAGVKKQDIDPRTLEMFRQQNLGELLAARSSAFVKSTGLNTFSTLSLRGASAAQSAVYWEGVPLMNGATGLVDVSSLPLAFAGNVRIDYGSSAALRGSGNVGGAVMLYDAQPVFTTAQEWRGSLGLGTGAFGQLNGGARAALRARRFFMDAGISASRARNDFPAEDELGRRFRMPHAGQQQVHGAAQLAFLLDERSTLSIHSQITAGRREIPPALFESQSLKQQDETDYRFLAQWRQQAKGNASLHRYAKLAFLSNELSYQDSSIGLQSGLHGRQLFAEAGSEFSFFKKGKLLLFLPLQYCWLQEKSSTQFRAAVAASASIPFFQQKENGLYRLETALNFRLESFDGTWIGLPGMNLSYRLADGWRLRGNAQYTYRAPTLNELYYRPGGNSQLRPEHGWSFDAGLDWKEEWSEGWSHSHSLSAYNRNIEDWIIWLGGAIWTPHNVAAVRSQGIELENSVGQQGRRFFWRLSLSGSLIRSTVMESGLTGDSSIDRQLPYVPPAMGAAVLTAGRKDFFIEWSTTYTGRRYTLSDESDWLAGYSISGLSAVAYLPLRQHRLRLQLMLNNIFNARYEVVAFRPMPGFGWALNAMLYLRNGG